MPLQDDAMTHAKTRAARKKRGRNGVGDETPNRIRPRTHYKLRFVTAATVMVTGTAMAIATVSFAH
jgi:hypothetical protein